MDGWLAGTRKAYMDAGRYLGNKDGRGTDFGCLKFISGRYPRRNSMDNRSIYTPDELRIDMVDRAMRGLVCKGKQVREYPRFNVLSSVRSQYL